jgi:hypothetical protein
MRSLTLMTHHAHRAPPTVVDAAAILAPGRNVHIVRDAQFDPPEETDDELPA